MSSILLFFFLIQPVSGSGTPTSGFVYLPLLFLVITVIFSNNSPTKENTATKPKETKKTDQRKTKQKNIASSKILTFFSNDYNTYWLNGTRHWFVRYEGTYFWDVTMQTKYLRPNTLNMEKLRSLESVAMKFYVPCYTTDNGATSSQQKRQHIFLPWEQYIEFLEKKCLQNYLPHLLELKKGRPEMVQDILKTDTLQTDSIEMNEFHPPKRFRKNSYHIPTLDTQTQMKGETKTEALYNKRFHEVFEASKPRVKEPIPHLFKDFYILPTPLEKKANRGPDRVTRAVRNMELYYPAFANLFGDDFREVVLIYLTKNVEGQGLLTEALKILNIHEGKKETKILRESREARKKKKGRK
jgi:hypothetical protein